MKLLGVTIAIVQEDRILLTKRNDLPVWCLPGGAVEEGESLAQAAVREAREETGLEVALIRLIGAYSRPNWRAGGAHEILFAAPPTGGVLLTSTEETTDAGYFGREDLPAALLCWHHSRVIDALDGRVGITRVQEVAWPAGIADRQALYRLRDQGHWPLQAFVDRFCGPPDPAEDRIEVG
jgi:ADP-ribose pyrophosphatase YjhB (NUDIX family)